MGVSKKSSIFYFYCDVSFKHKIKGIYWETAFSNISETVVKTCTKDLSKTLILILASKMKVEN